MMPALSLPRAASQPIHRTSVRWLSVLVALALMLGSFVQPVQAALIGAQDVARVTDGLTQADPAQRAVQLDRIAAALARADVQSELERHGLTTQQAMDRVQALSDAEVAQLADRVDELPAGGIIGAILLVFFVLLLTDILGLTKVFPFTR